MSDAVAQVAEPGPEVVDLVVLGAGPAGVAATRRAAQAGRSVVLLEPTELLGGRASSHEVAGVRVDLGSHRVHESVDPELLADLRGLLGTDLQTRERDGRVRVAGRWVGYPVRPGELASVLPGRLLARAAADTVLGVARRRHDDSYAGVLRAGLGPALYDAVYGPFARKLWGLDGEQLDAEEARRRIGADSAWKVAARAGRHRGGRGGRGLYHYPRNGFGQITEALVTAARADGARIVTGARLHAVRARHDGVLVEWDGGRLLARHAFSTLPLTALGRVARPAPSAQAAGDAAGLVFRAMVLVYLVHRGGRWTGHDAHYLPGPETPMTRISEPANYRDSPDDPTDRSVLCAEIPCAVGDATWSAAPDDLARLVQQSLARVGLPPIDLPAEGGVEVRRLPRVYPVYTVGYQQRLAGLSAWADRLAHVTVLGRLGLFVHDTSHTAMRMAYDAADCLLPGGGFDHAAWASARERSRRQVLDD
ncbi:protoporphyrinogen/coproporphyrinogen oxidase [Angustibacter aerolatus]